MRRVIGERRTTKAASGPDAQPNGEHASKVSATLTILLLAAGMAGHCQVGLRAAHQQTRSLNVHFVSKPSHTGTAQAKVTCPSGALLQGSCLRAGPLPHWGGSVSTSRGGQGKPVSAVSSLRKLSSGGYHYPSRLPFRDRLEYQLPVLPPISEVGQIRLTEAIGAREGHVRDITEVAKDMWGRDH